MELRNIGDMLEVEGVFAPVDQQPPAGRRPPWSDGHDEPDPVDTHERPRSVAYLIDVLTRLLRHKPSRIEEPLSFRQQI